MKELTRAEEQIMQVLWDLGKGFVKDIIEAFKGRHTGTRIRNGEQQMAGIGAFGQIGRASCRERV